MIIYEITATVNGVPAEEFEQFMRGVHIPDLLGTGCFKAAEIARVSEAEYRIRYRAKNRAALESYFETEAERLREDFTKRFPKGITVARAILEVLEVWPPVGG